MVFQGAKYEEASRKCREFILQQFNTNNFDLDVSFGRNYSKMYAGQVMWGWVDGLSDDLPHHDPQYIGLKQFYDYDYTGVVEGSGPSGCGVAVHVISDSDYPEYFYIENGEWKSKKKYREVYHNVKNEQTGALEDKTVEYELDYKVRRGFKDFYLCTSLSENWRHLEYNPRLDMDSYVLEYTPGEEVSLEEGGGAYGYFDDYLIRLYTYTDAEYLNDTLRILRTDNPEHPYMWYSLKTFSGKKIAKVVEMLPGEGERYTVHGISAGDMNISNGRLPASFLIPQDDPQYDKEGTTARGVYGYMLNSRTWAYDVGLALLVLTTSGDYGVCREICNRMKHEQNYNGSFNFSYDAYIGQLFEDYVRTGAMGWAVWGICYYTLESGNREFVDMIEKAGKWLLSRQVKDRNDPRYGLLTGGYGAYNMEDYSYIDTDIDWCSVEHQCSALQALLGCALVLKDEKYYTAAQLVKEQLYLLAYDKENGRFYQGINGGSPDGAWALDCTTWAGTMAFSIVNKNCALACIDTAREVYLTECSIEQSSQMDYYNMTYSDSRSFSGFKPYSDKTLDYEGAPDIVWSEGTLGYAALALKLGLKDEAKHYVDEMIALQNCDNSTGGVLYTTATYGMLPWEFHVWESVVSSAWLYLIINNPGVLFPTVTRPVFYVNKIKNIVDERP